MNKTQDNKANGGLIVAILIAAVLISGGLIYVGMQMGGEKLDKDDIKAAIIEVFTGQPAPDENADDENNDDNDADGDAPKSDELVGDDAFIGDADAPVTIVEFSDFQCPYCANFVSETYPLIKQNYIDTGKVKLVFRDFPLGGHPAALPAAIAAECVREQKGDSAYFEYHDQIFANQTTLGTDTVGTLTSLAEGISGLTIADFSACLTEEKYKAEALADLADGKKFGVTGTPSFFVNSEFVRGAQPYSVFEQLIEAELAK